MRRVFIIRKDLNMKPGKLGAMLAHCAEAYWTNLLKRDFKYAEDDGLLEAYDGGYRFPIEVDNDIWDEYANKIFTKTICECKNKDALHKVDNVIKELELTEGTDYGYINDKCLTDLTPENPDGTCTIGMWFRPLPDEDAHKISKKFKLYGAFDKINNTQHIIAYSVNCTRSWCEGEETIIYARYTSFEEAKKHLNYLFDELSADKGYSECEWRNDSKDCFSTKNKLFKYDNTEIFEILEEEIEIADKFEI